jgi:hypothetical protein
MNRKAKRRKFAKILRRHCKLTLPESAKIARWFLGEGHWEREAPPHVVTRMECKCAEGCCWGDVHYMRLKSGEMATLNWLEYEFMRPILAAKFPV